MTCIQTAALVQPNSLFDYGIGKSDLKTKLYAHALFTSIMIYEMF